MSKSNEHEAKFLAGLCRHLILQGYTAERITILTTYTGQMFLLKKETNALSTCKGVRVTVVDNYQGEENDIILLSLVRSNEENNIGFLKTDNRICVAISRAK
jgi:superfamily I DNA and/or RNA helicase